MVPEGGIQSSTRVLCQGRRNPGIRHPIKVNGIRKR
jgi:hypothetical protein